MNDAEYKESLQTAFDLFERARVDEALAREREAAGYDPAEVMRCGFDWGGVDCRFCETMPECDLWLREYQDLTIRLFKSAMSGYQKALETLRRVVAERDEPDVWRMLARTLLAIDVHPDNMNKDTSDLYWEAQFWYLRLYFEADDKEAFEKAKLCEAFRHATVLLIGE